ncbi:hypothetical protein LSH36_58g16015 [Paralvinella palmiformis]|uniref:Dynein axonemal assembly factor 4 n=1 Tax=Paralvinella palmiformis TaxID=53620 RepID=A0AAD9K4N6_9ANNE|nr:hypothetical protein LSH36_58g16015 [Paralvinella palmiformis]
MPIVIKDYTWEETEKTLYITIPLKGVRPNKVDIFSIETYIKVHYPPYLFESFLFEPVYDQKSTAQVGNGVVVFKLEKQTPSVWGQLQHPQTDDRDWQQNQRQLAVERYRERAEQEKATKVDAKRDCDRFGVKSQMA